MGARPDRGSAILLALILGLLIEAVAGFAVMQYMASVKADQLEKRRMEKLSFASNLQTVFADPAQCLALLRAGTDLSVRATARATISPNSVASSPSHATGQVRYVYYPMTTTGSITPNYYAFKPVSSVGPYNPSTNQLINGGATPFTFLSLASPPSMSQYSPTQSPWRVSQGGVYLRALNLIEVEGYRDTPGFARAFVLWADFGTATDASGKRLEAPDLKAGPLLEIAALTDDFTNTGPVKSCVPRAMAATSQPQVQAGTLSIPYSLQCPAGKIVKPVAGGYACVDFQTTCPPGQSPTGVDSYGTVACR